MPPGSRAHAGGFTYLAVLLAVALLGVALAAVGTVWSTEARRDREAQLLFAGEAYRAAIASYYRQGPIVGQLPGDLHELLEDTRTLQPTRHLRRLYPDPMTGNADWQLIRAADAGIVGVYSSSGKAPLKRANFPANEAPFADADCYCAWRFEFTPARWRRAPPKP
ncbi:MAG TPA: hypothetical protein VE046_12320 [Steroidobacteraceae bacterium]|nr:hypothetical protein [Steroidobacteraceae bacterium]